MTTLPGTRGRQSPSELQSISSLRRPIADGKRLYWSTRSAIRRGARSAGGSSTGVLAPCNSSSVTIQRGTQTVALTSEEPCETSTFGAARSKPWKRAFDYLPGMAPRPTFGIARSVVEQVAGADAIHAGASPLVARAAVPGQAVRPYARYARQPNRLARPFHSR